MRDVKKLFARGGEENASLLYGYRKVTCEIYGDIKGLGICTLGYFIDTVANNIANIRRFSKKKKKGSPFWY